MDIDSLYELFLKHNAVQTDTRKLKEGDLFFALKGPNFDGNSFAQQALEKGAAAVVIDDPNYAVAGKTYLVDDCLTALQLLAKHHRQQFTIPFIAITGSNGKTTTKEFVHAVLSSSFQTYTTEGNFNNHIGVPLTILKIRKDAAFAVIEMGANHVGEIASYCNIAMPTHGVITNCGKAHLEGFGGIEGVRKGKGELFNFLRQYNGGVFVMWDYDYLRDMSKGIQTVYKYGTGDDADLSGNTVGEETLMKVAFTKGHESTLSTKLVGNYNLPNVLAAVAIGKFFHVPDEKINEAIESYTPSNSRSQLMQRASNEIILDAYNANPSSMKLAIENFSKQKGDKILMLGAMAEMGLDSGKEHQGIIDEIKKHEWSKVVLVGGDFLKLDHPYIQFSSPDEAGEWLRKNKIENSTLLIKGSRSMKMEKVLDYLN
ncbi:MAG TPA: UDP-N-acetylmuramoyl-tripeptide--D-alanyl-D-alanine ligase [Chitinophagaceae bacterium]|nr:UDP-N-acetylmuramoyl-tripeptide--D-alanyl-D-alanine ligase [Chitinophagaceae bacterium]